MVKLNKIYTRTGDAGETALVTGARVAKYAPRMQAIGSVDETNAALGMARASLLANSVALDSTLAGLDRIMERVQNDLFDLGADLATPLDPQVAEKPGAALRINPKQVERLEHEIDSLNETLSPLTSFILPGGAPLAAALHMARTICRRAERDMVALQATESGSVNQRALNYINRLSDLLFVMARSANDGGRADHLWTPGENR